jgi:hypothetical protein
MTAARKSMPQTAAFIDQLRDVFGADQVDPSIRAGLRGEPNRFYALEAGLELGTPCTAPADRLCRPVDPLAAAPANHQHRSRADDLNQGAQN